MDLLVVGVWVEDVEVVVAGFPDGHGWWVGGFVFDLVIEGRVGLLHGYGVALFEDLEDGGYGSLAGFGEDEMDVIGHDDPGFELCLVPGCGLVEDLLEEVS